MPLDMEPFYETLLREARALEPAMRARRRDFHTYAEPGWCEFRTASRIARELTDLGYRVLVGRDVCLEEARMGLPSPETLERQYRRALDQGAEPAFAEPMRGGFTGVAALLDCGEGPVVAMRFDIDALAVREAEGDGHRPSREGFCSVNDGVMHACGHDGHAAVGLAVARLLMARRAALRGRIKLIFQPAEEGVRGAASIAARGLLDDVDYILAGHMGDSAGTDAQIGFPTDATLATTKLDVCFRGQAAHAGLAPEAGRNALLAAATAVLNLHAIPRSGRGDSRVNVGSLRAGGGRNVVCERAAMELEVRGATTEVNDYLEAYARRVVRGAAAMHGCDCEVTVAGAAGSLESDPALRRRAEAVARDCLGLRVRETTFGASEDYAALVERVRGRGGRGLFFTALTPCAGPLHSPAFDFREEALPNAAALFCALAYSLQREGPV